MTKKRKAKAVATVHEQPAPAPPEQVVPQIEQDEQPIRHRTYVLITTTDLRIVQERFAEGRPGLPLVSVHPPRSRTTDAQREYRRKYRLRPEVKAKLKECRKQRAARLRAAAKQIEAPTETAE